MGGKDIAVYLAVLGRVFPVINLHRANDGGTPEDGDVFRFMAVRVPGAHKTGPVVGHHVETFHAVEIEVVNEAYRAAVINRQTAFDQPDAIFFFFILCWHLNNPEGEC